MSGPAFGFSVGDFITAIGIVSKVVRSLKQTGGASSRYIQVLNQLETLTRILQTLESLQATQDDAFFINAIRGAAPAARFPLDEFLSKIEKYEPSLNPAHRKSIIKRAPKATKWAVHVEEEVAKLHLALDAHLLSLNLLLQLREHRIGDIKESRRKLAHEETLSVLSQQTHGINVISSTVSAARADSLDAHKKTLDGIASVQISSQANASALDEVKQIATSLADRASRSFTANNQSYQQIVNSVMSNTEQLMKLQHHLVRAPDVRVESCIFLLDALDRPHKLPYEHFQDFAVVQAHLKSKFRNIPGGLQVKAGLYQLVREGRRPKIVDGEAWARSVFPGSRVSMAIVLSSLRIPHGRCPRPNCHQEVSRRSSGKTRIRCENCGLVYYPYSPQSTQNHQRELDMVIKSQVKIDKGYFGRRYPPKDVSVIASVSAGTMSQLTQTTRSELASRDPNTELQPESISAQPSDPPLPQSPIDAGKVSALTEANLVLWEDNADDYLTARLQDNNAGDINQPRLPLIDWNNGPSGMIAWLNQSSMHEFGNNPPPIDPLPGYESDSNDEEDDLEVLRRVCIAESIPAAKHYLDAPEYDKMAVSALTYLRKIVDRYPKLPPLLARRLAEKNLSRASKLTKIRDYSQVKTEYERAHHDFLMDQRQAYRNSHAPILLSSQVNDFAPSAPNPNATQQSLPTLHSYLQAQQHINDPVASAFQTTDSSMSPELIQAVTKDVRQQMVKNRRKRLKVIKACEGCRRRKIKCDAATTNTWPCTACKRLKLFCIPPPLSGGDGGLTLLDTTDDHFAPQSSTTPVQ